MTKPLIHDYSREWLLGYMTCWARQHKFDFEEDIKSFTKEALFEAYLTTLK